MLPAACQKLCLVATQHVEVWLEPPKPLEEPPAQILAAWRDADPKADWVRWYDAVKRPI
jgi:hypothetical protein